MAALQALKMIQALPSDSSVGEFSSNEEYETVNAAESVAKLVAEFSDFEDEETVLVLPRPFESEESMVQCHDKNQSADSTDADASQPIRSKDESLWMLANTS